MASLRPMGTQPTTQSKVSTLRGSFPVLDANLDEGAAKPSEAVVRFSLPFFVSPPSLALSSSRYLPARKNSRGAKPSRRRFRGVRKRRLAGPRPNERKNNRFFRRWAPQLAPHVHCRFEVRAPLRVVAGLPTVASNQAETISRLKPTLQDFDARVTRTSH